MFESVAERNDGPGWGGGGGEEGGVGSLVNAAKLRHDLTNHEDFWRNMYSISALRLDGDPVKHSCKTEKSIAT